MANLGCGDTGTFLLSVSIQAFQPNSDLFHHFNLFFFDFPTIAPITDDHHSMFWRLPPRLNSLGDLVQLLPELGLVEGPGTTG